MIVPGGVPYKWGQPGHKRVKNTGQRPGGFIFGDAPTVDPNVAARRQFTGPNIRPGQGGMHWDRTQNKMVPNQNMGGSGQYPGNNNRAGLLEFLLKLLAQGKTATGHDFSNHALPGDPFGRPHPTMPGMRQPSQSTPLVQRANTGIYGGI